MNATTGFFTKSLMYWAASCSALPPISPTITIAFVSGSSFSMRTAWIWVVPMIGSPPTPMQVLCPMPSAVNWATTSYTSVPERLTTPTLPSRKTSPGMIPTRVFVPGVITPGQFGPIRMLEPPAIDFFTITMSITGIPSVMQTISGILAAAASRIASAANGAGTKMIVTFAPVFPIASATVLKISTPSCCWPPRLG